MRKGSSGGSLVKGALTILGTLFIASSVYGIFAAGGRVLVPLCLLCLGGLMLVYVLRKSPRNFGTYLVGYGGLVMLVTGGLVFSWLFKSPARYWVVKSGTFQLCPAATDQRSPTCPLLAQGSSIELIEAADKYAWATKKQTGTDVGPAHFRVVVGGQKGLMGWSDQRWELQEKPESDGTAGNR